MVIAARGDRVDGDVDPEAAGDEVAHGLKDADVGLEPEDDRSVGIGGFEGRHKRGVVAGGKGLFFDGRRVGGLQERRDGGEGAAETLRVLLGAEDRGAELMSSGQHDGRRSVNVGEAFRRHRRRQALLNVDDDDGRAAGFCAGDAGHRSKVAGMTRRDHIISLDKLRVWHPYTPMKQWIDDAQPLVVERAEGAHFYDVDGKGYIDANSSWWVALLGHRHPRLVATLKEQADKLCHVALAGITHEPAARLAEEIIAIAPEGLSRVFFSDDGSTSVEVALKLALHFWHNHGQPQRKRFVALDGAFHGDTIGATGLGGVEVFRKPFDGVGVPCTHVTVPPRTVDDDGYDVAKNAVARAVADDDVAAVVLEPLLQGAAGMRMYPPQYLQHVRALCDEHDVLFIADEVFTGYGRAGSMWACAQAGVTPDILCTAKGFSGGILPMAATLVGERIFDAFLGDKDRAFYYGHTFCGHPLGAAIAREVLAIYRDERIIENAQPKMQRIARAFDHMSELDGVHNTRSLGMVGALDLSGGGYLGSKGWDVYREALARGAYLRPLGDTVYIAPPLNIDDDDLETLLRIVVDSVTAAR